MAFPQRDHENSNEKGEMNPGRSGCSREMLCFGPGLFHRPRALRYSTESTMFPKRCSTSIPVKLDDYVPEFSRLHKPHRPNEGKPIK